MQHDQKGFILFESLIVLFVFTIVILSYFVIYSHIMNQRADRSEFFQAFLLARSELENATLECEPAFVTKSIYSVYVDLTSYDEHIQEVQVSVQWEGRNGELKNIKLKKLVLLSGDEITHGQIKDLLMLN